MSRPIIDKAEVALEYPDKVYVGTFERTSSARFPKFVNQRRTSNHELRKAKGTSKL